VGSRWVVINRDREFGILHLKAPSPSIGPSTLAPEGRRNHFCLRQPSHSYAAQEPEPCVAEYRVWNRTLGLFRHFHPKSVTGQAWPCWVTRLLVCLHLPTRTERDSKHGACDWVAPLKVTLFKVALFQICNKTMHRVTAGSMACRMVYLKDDSLEVEEVCDASEESLLGSNSCITRRCTERSD
jgi:hypothetical protein